MSEQATLEVFLIVNADGEYEVGPAEEDAMQRFEENIIGTGSRRLIKLNVTLTLPEDEEVEIEVPDTAGKILVEVAENGESGRAT